MYRNNETFKELTCRRHLILSPGAIIAVVKIPANIPALPICGSLKHQGTFHRLLIFTGKTFKYPTGGLAEISGIFGGWVPPHKTTGELCPSCHGDILMQLSGDFQKGFFSKLPRDFIESYSYFVWEIGLRQAQWFLGIIWAQNISEISVFGKLKFCKHLPY